MKQALQVIRKSYYILNRPQKILCVVVFLLTCVGSILECIGVSAIIPVVNVVMDPMAAMNGWIGELVPSMWRTDYEQAILFVIVCVIVVFLIKNLFFIFLSWMRVKFACKIQREISIHMMKSYMSRGYEFFLNQTMGNLNRGVNDDVKSVYEEINAAFRLLSNLFTVLMICLFMFFTDWIMSVALLGTACICAVLILFVLKKKMIDAGIQIRKYTALAYQTMYEAFQGIKDVLVLHKQQNIIGEYEERQVRMQVVQAKRVVGVESPAYIIEAICVTGLMFAVAFRATGGARDTELIATMATFAIAAFRILPSLGRISNELNQIMATIPGVNAIYENMKEAESFEELHPEFSIYTSQSSGLIARYKAERIFSDILDNQGTLPKEILQDHLSVENINFSYTNSSESIFKNLNLKIKKGQSIAIIGASGTGKSTLVDILLGLLIPQAGGIYVDNTKVADIPDEWAKMVGYVPQSVFLSSASIKRNVAFGELEEDIEEERVKEALQRAELLPFVEELPQGMDTCVGDRGLRLSGGQRQRIAIARALYHRPEILVLDEATSALDNETESAIMSAIESLQGKVTLIIVAHRLTTIRKCDVIYEVKDKNIVVREKKEIFTDLLNNEKGQ